MQELPDSHSLRLVAAAARVTPIERSNMAGSESARWTHLDEEELLAAIGQAVAESQRHAFPPSRRRLVEDGRRWLKDNMALLRLALCSDSTVKKHAEARESELLFEAVCEVVIHVVAHVPAGCVAAYCVRKGIDRICTEPTPPSN